MSIASKVRLRTFGFVAIGSAVLFILRSRLLVYSAGSGVNIMQVVLFGFSVRLLYFARACVCGCNGDVCSAVTVECCFLYPCYVSGFAVM